MGGKKQVGSSDPPRGQRRLPQGMAQSLELRAESWGLGFGILIKGPEFRVLGYRI